jgi:hypothetical protein
MALFTVDPNNVFGKTVDEAGTYNVKVADSSVYKESSTHKPMAVLNFEVLDGKYAGGQIRYDNVVWDDSTTEKYYQSITRFNTIMVMAAVPEGTPLNSIQEFVTGMIGKKLAIDVDWTQSQNGKFYLTVKALALLSMIPSLIGNILPQSILASSKAFLSKLITLIRGRFGHVKGACISLSWAI